MKSQRWFHHHLKGVDAENLLMKHGVNGSFLARPSNSNSGSFTLSVRRNDEVTHIKIHNSDEYLDLYGGEKFATLAELVEYYMENPGQLKEKDGAIIELKRPLISEDPTTERWFHGHITGKESEKLLMEKGRNGSFLVRESVHSPDNYVLSVVTGERVAHVMIYRKAENKFDVGGGEQFQSLKELIDYYSKTPMVERTGGVVLLKQPFNATRVKVATIEQRMAQLEKENGKSSGRAGFWEEFEELQQESQNKNVDRKVGTLPQNKEKNRYKNILPFDTTRVILKGTDEDYINANYITFPSQGESMEGGAESYLSTTKSYIATQGTLPHTLADFWRMVWQENSRLLVMITKEVERGRNKCVRYWPADTEEVREFPAPSGPPYLVRMLSEHQSADYILRELELSREGMETRATYHFHFVAWPDHGTPNDPSSVLNFLHDINARQENLLTQVPAGPIVVHCSAGIGRTGTFIVIDMIITQIKQLGLTCDVDISRTIQSVREQRSGMVQTEAQYRFIYKAVHQYIETVSKRIDVENDLKKIGRDYTNISHASKDMGGHKDIPESMNTDHTRYNTGHCSPTCDPPAPSPPAAPTSAGGFPPLPPKTGHRSNAI